MACYALRRVRVRQRQHIPRCSAYIPWLMCRRLRQYQRLSAWVVVNSLLETHEVSEERPFSKASAVGKTEDGPAERCDWCASRYH